MEAKFHVHFLSLQYKSYSFSVCFPLSLSFSLSVSPAPVVPHQFVLISFHIASDRSTTIAIPCITVDRRAPSLSFRKLYAPPVIISYQINLLMHDLAGAGPRFIIGASDGSYQSISYTLSYY